MNIINKLAIILCFVSVTAHAESVTPFKTPTSAANSLKDIRNINGDNVQEFLKNSAPVMPLKIEPTPSAVTKLYSGPGIFLTLGVPASLADAVRAPIEQPAKVETKKINFSSDDEPSLTKPTVVVAIKNPLLQNAANMSDAMPPAVWLLGFGLLGMAGISRRKKTPHH